MLRAFTESRSGTTPRLVANRNDLRVGASERVQTSGLESLTTIRSVTPISKHKKARSVYVGITGLIASSGSLEIYRKATKIFDDTHLST